ncbi:hypothetical protein MKW98_028245, partial [Papaver atlanticum]
MVMRSFKGNLVWICWWWWFSHFSVWRIFFSKVHGSLACAGKVREQTPKVELTRGCNTTNVFVTAGQQGAMQFQMKVANNKASRSCRSCLPISSIWTVFDELGFISL